MKSAKGKGSVKRHRRGKRSRKRFRPFAFTLRILAWATAISAFWCAYMLWLINSYEMPKIIPKADAAIVLGASLWDNKPSPGLRERLDYALKLYEQGKFQNFIVTGGLDRNTSDSITEAEGMRNYLMDKGIPASNIVLEKKARSTYQNLLFSKPLAEQNGWNSLIIVTHDYHSFRSGEIAHFLDYPSVVVVGFKSQVLSTAYNQSREMLALSKWKLDAVLLRLDIPFLDPSL